LARVNAIGPGKADLLESIALSGSIAEAARRMGLSYRRAWNMVKALNRSFRAPLVETVKGGRLGGSARLTATGDEVLRRYRGMESNAAESIAAEVEDFRKFIRGP
jgi:molybdate transport system regulatory protein